MSIFRYHFVSRTLALRPSVLLSTSSVRWKDPWSSMSHTKSIETTRARLVYQSRKRGTLENDLLLSTFAQEHLGTMDAEELSEFDKLMDESDWDIYYWATEKRTPPERWTGSRLLEKLRIQARNEGKVVRRMPDLHL
ncbi:Flavinator of succinate dehydrogenase domain containing protein [Russula decolorans]